MHTLVVYVVVTLLVVGTAVNIASVGALASTDDEWSAPLTAFSPDQTCGFNGYDLSALSTVELNTTGRQSGPFLATYTLRLCGRTTHCVSAMICQLADNSDYYVIAQPTNLNWTINNSVLSLNTNNGESQGCNHPRQSTITFACSAVTNFSFVNEPAQCVYNFRLTTPLVCAAGSSSSTGSAPPEPTCGTGASAGAYDLSSLAAEQLFGISIDRTFQYIWQLCGAVSDSFCDKYAPGSSLCQLTIPPTSGSLIAVAGTGSQQMPFQWSYINNNPQLGVIGVAVNGPACGINSLNSALAARLVCGQSNSTLFVVDESGATPQSTLCVYLLTFVTSVVCPVGVIPPYYPDVAAIPDMGMKEWVVQRQQERR